MSAQHVIEGELPEGVEVDGVVHRAFALRLPTVRDNIEAIDEVGTSNQLAVSAAILARQITRLGGLKPEQITFDLVVGMHPEDYNALESKASELEKKRKAARPAAAASTASGSPSVAPA